MSDPDRVVFQSALVTVGEFRCPVGHPAFRDSGPIRESCVVFPRTSVMIRHEGARGFVTDSAMATLYNKGQRYERLAVSREGDRCDWFAVRTDVMREIVEPLDPRAAAAESGPMRFEHAPVPYSVYLDQRRLFSRLRSARSGADVTASASSAGRIASSTGSCEAVEPLDIEEQVARLVARTIGLAYTASTAATKPRRRSPGDRAQRQRRQIVDAARALLATRFTERLNLTGISRAIGCSPFHLARAFRETTGSTIHAHVVSLRLRAALERLDERADLTEVALESGFSSHSHFTAAFRRAFGATPSAFVRARS